MTIISRYYIIVYVIDKCELNRNITIISRYFIIVYITSKCELKRVSIFVVDL